MSATPFVSQASGQNPSVNRMTSAFWIAKKAPTTAGGTDGYSGLKWNSKAAKALGVLCNAVSIADIPIEPLETYDFLSGGKYATSKSVGKKVAEFEIEIDGNSLATVRALIGLTYASSVNSWQVKTWYRAAGHLLLQSYDVDTELLKNQMLVMNLEVMFKTMPGLGTDGERRLKATFRAPAARIVYADIEAGQMINVEMSTWDGSATTFVLGAGTSSYASSTTPVALQVDSNDASLTDYKTHIIEATIDGEEITLANGAFATSTFTVGSAPTNGARSIWIYLCDPASYSQALFTSDPNPSTVGLAMHGWGLYMRN